MSLSLLQAISGFELANKVRRLSPKTVKWYNDNLVRFAEWTAQQCGPQTLGGITTAMIRSFMHYLIEEARPYEGHRLTATSERKLSPASILAFYSSLSAFFRWCESEELLVKNPMATVARPKVPRKIVPTFSEEEIKGLLSASGSLPQDTGARMKAMLLFLLDTGVRINELTTLKRESLDLELGRALVMGKGAKERHVYYGNTTRKALWRYLELHRPTPGPKNDFVFLTRQGLPLRMRLTQHDLFDLGHKAGVTDVHPHRFRHTAAVQFLRNGGDVFSLQKMLGHTTLDMVRRYVELASEDVEKAHRVASPVDNWKL